VCRVNAVGGVLVVDFVEFSVVVVTVIAIDVVTAVSVVVGVSVVASVAAVVVIASVIGNGFIVDELMLVVSYSIVEIS
jgi:hypothetical protein